MKKFSRVRVQQIKTGAAGAMLSTLLIAGASARADDTTKPDKSADTQGQATAQAGNAPSRAAQVPPAQRSSTPPTTRPLRFLQGMFGNPLVKSQFWMDTAYRQPSYIAPYRSALARLDASTQTQNAQQTTPPATPPADAAPPSRSLPSPLDSPPFPNADWVVPMIGENQDAPDFPLQNALFGNRIKKSRIKIYGWVDVGGNLSSSHNSNSPLSYALVPNKIELDQAVLRIERQPDTVQTNHIDWGFRLSNIFGTDYRYTVANGYFSDPLLKKNNLYGYDLPEMYGQVYFPKVAQGMVVQFGRYISPMDIEAQLSPQNYLYSHSLMFTFDPYTLTGANAEIRLSRQWLIHFGAHGGNDVAPWTNSSHLQFELLAGWMSKDNRDSLWGGLDSIGFDPRYRNGRDNLQVIGGVWGHKFSQLWHTQTEGYYIWQYDAALGGSAITGPVEPYGGGGGQGPIIPGRTYSLGFVNYLEYKVNNRDYVSLRNDFLDDPQGQRTGFRNKYSSHTIGYSHFITPLTIIRPEFRYERAYNNPAYDNGTRKEQFTFSADIIQRF